MRGWGRACVCVPCYLSAVVATLCGVMPVVSHDGAKSASCVKTAPPCCSPSPLHPVLLFVAAPQMSNRFAVLDSDDDEWVGAKPSNDSSKKNTKKGKATLTLATALQQSKRC